MDAAGFLVEFPEFVLINAQKPALIAATLARAAKHCSARVWGDRYERGVYLKCAHFLAMSPFGETARLVKGTNATTVYETQFAEELAALPIRMFTT